MKAGDQVRFGRYEQDGNPKTRPEPIVWTVLEVRKDRVLLLSDKILDAFPWESKGKNVPWTESDLAFSLNSVFLTSAFTKEEADCLTGPDDSGAPLGRVFVLSREELERLLPDEGSRKAPATYYSRMNGAFSSGCGYFWTRDGAVSKNLFRYVGSDGHFYTCEGNNPDVGARPAVWVSLQKLASLE